MGRAGNVPEFKKTSWAIIIAAVALAAVLFAVFAVNRASIPDEPQKTTVETAGSGYSSELDLQNMRFHITGAEAAGLTFAREVYGARLMNYSEDNPFRVTEYEMLEYTQIEVAGNTVSGEFTFAVMPVDGAYYAGLYTQRGTGEYEGRMILTRGFTLELDEENYWNCVRIENVVKTPDSFQIAAAYQAAREAMDWFQMTTMPVEDGVVEASGNKVNHPTIKTYGDLKKHLENLFSYEIAAALLATGRYFDVENALYATVADRGGDIFKGDETYEVVRESNEKIIYRVTVENLGDDLESVVGYSTHDMVYEFVDGRWVFSKFEPVR